MQHTNVQIINLSLCISFVVKYDNLYNEVKYKPKLNIKI